MRVKIGDKIYDSADEPVMIIFEEGEKELIATMGDQKKFCSFPGGMSREKAKEFMKI